MFRKCLLLLLLSLIFGKATLQIVIAQSSAEHSAERIRVEKLKTDVYRFGLGKDSKVVVKLKDGTQLKGYISQTIEDSFDLTDAKTRQFTTIPYRDVAHIKQQGRSIGAKFALEMGVVAAIIVIAVIKREKGSGICPLGCR
jgi:hypothetical protein